jgi:hypothetical protein
MQGAVYLAIIKSNFKRNLPVTVMLWGKSDRGLREYPNLEKGRAG